jgi:hypothetical protein
VGLTAVTEPDPVLPQVLRQLAKEVADSQDTVAKLRQLVTLLIAGEPAAVHTAAGQLDLDLAELVPHLYRLPA